MTALPTLPSAAAVAVATSAGKTATTATTSKATGASTPTDPAAGEVSFADVLSAQLGLSSTAPTAVLSASKDKEGPAAEDQALPAVSDILVTDPASALPMIPLALPVAVPAPASAVGEDSEHDAPQVDQALIAKTLLPSVETRRSPFIPEQPASESPATEAAAVPANFAAALQGLPAPVQDASRREHAVSHPDGSTALLPVATPAVASEQQSTHRGAPLVTAVPVPVQDTRWSNAFSERVVWITGQQVQSAEIHLEPPQLGPIEVRVSITNDQANLLINAPHAVARDAIQMSLPRLQEMLMEIGLTLGNVSVGAHNAGGQQARDGADRGTNRSGSDEVASVDTRSTPLRVQRGLGLVDLFA